MNLIFDPERHKYTLDGEDLPSVSKVKEPLTDFSMVDPVVLQRACDWGHAVHSMVELHLNGTLDLGSLDDALFPVLDAWESFLAEVKPFDDPKGAMIDLKSRKFDRVSDPVQLAAYHQLYLENEITEVTIERPMASVQYRYAGTADIIIPPKRGGPITNWRILYLGMDGKYTYTPAHHAQAWPIFGHLLSDYWRQQQTEQILNSWRNRI